MAFRRRRSQRQLQGAIQRLPDQINHILTAISQKQPIVPIFQAILQSGLDLTRTPMDLAFLRIIDPQTGKTKYRVTIADRHAHNIIDDFSGITGRAMKTKTAQCIAQVSKDRAFVLLAEGVQSELAVPISVGDICYGVMNFESPTKGWFTANDTFWMTQLALIAGLALAIEEERAITEADLARGASRQNQQIENAFDTLLDDVLQLFAAPPGNLMPDLMAEVLLDVPNSDQIITLRIRPDASQALKIRLHKGEGRAGQVFATGVAFAGEVYRSDQLARGTGSTGDIAHLFSTKSALVYPLKMGNEIIGILNVESSITDTFLPPAIAILEQSGIVDRIIQEMSKIERQHLTEDTIVHDLLDSFARDALRSQRPEDLQGTYFQILQVATQIIQDPNISGGLILIRDEAEQLIKRAVAPEAGRHYWMVRAAKIGDFDAPPEWRLEDKSISRRIITNKKGEVINDAGNDPDYRPSLSSSTETSELIVPLIDALGNPLGVIGLDSPKRNTFDDTDLHHIEQLAAFAVSVIQHGEAFAQGQRAKQQIEFVKTMQDILSLLFPRELSTLVKIDIEQIRQKVFTLVLAVAQKETQSDYSVIVLPEISQESSATQETTMLRINRALPDDVKFDAAPWSVQHGVTGRAYRTGEVQSAPNTQEMRGADPDSFRDVFPEALSEIAVPMKRGDEVIGVLDIEAKHEHHYTRSDSDWAKFLALQCAFALSIIESVRKTQIDLTLSALNREVDQSLNTLSMIPLVHVRSDRDAKLLKMLSTYCHITGAVIGRVLLAQNAYVWGTEELDEANGTMHIMVSTNVDETRPGAQRNFPFTVGASIDAFRNKKITYFNNRQTRPITFVELHEQLIESGIFLPLYEGPVVVGVMSFGSDTPNAFTAEAYAGGEKVAAMASKLIVSTRLRLRQEQALRQRDFELEILQHRSTNVPEFMQGILSFGANLTEIQEGSGQIILFRHSNDETYFEEESAFSLEFRADSHREIQSSYDRKPITSEAVRQVITSKAPLLVIETDGSPFQLPAIQGQPQPIRSLICVPLLIAKGKKTELNLTQLHTRDLVVLGVILLTSPNRSEFSEADKYVLVTIAQTAVIGLNNIALLEESKELMGRVRHDFITALSPFNAALEKVEGALQQAIGSGDVSIAQESAQHAYREFADFRDASNLIANLMHWFFNLVEGTLEPESDPSIRTPAAFFEEQVGRSFNSLARYLTNYTITWIIQDEPIFIQGGRNTTRLITAVLFKYVDNALKFSSNDDVTIMIRGEDTRIIFEVKNSGEKIDEIDQKLLFQLHFRAKPETSIPGTGLGLYMVREIANRLHAEAYYRYDELLGQNIFALSVARA